MINKILPLIIGVALTSITSAQDLSFSSASEVLVEGTSNVHDWSAEVEQVTASGDWNESLSKLTVHFVVESMASGDRLMDKRIHRTLNAEEHPNIIFKAIESSQDGSNLSLIGDLTINGQTKRVVVQGTFEELESGDLEIKGSHVILFTDYGMDAPSFMFGAMKVGNQVTIRFNVIITK